MGEREDSLTENAPDTISAQFPEQFSKMELYKIWLEINGHPKKIEDFEPHLAHWRTTRHRYSVALDFASYLAILPVLFAAANNGNLLVPLILIPFIAYLIQPRLSNKEPYGVVGLFSAMSDASVQRKLPLTHRVPSIIDVDVYTLPVMTRAAEKLLQPTLVNLKRTLKVLEAQKESIKFDQRSLSNLKAEVEQEISRSDSDWQAILAPKLKKINQLLSEDEQQIADIAKAEASLSHRLTKLEDQLDQLKSRQDLISRLEHIEELESEDDESDIACKRLVQKILKGINEAQVGLTEANGIATAHEQAKLEIAELLEN